MKFPWQDTKTISPKQAAERLGVSLKTIYWRIYRGKLKASRPDGHWQIKEKELEKFLEK